MTTRFERRSWEELREEGVLDAVNSFLESRSWILITVLDDVGLVREVYPARLYDQQTSSEHTDNRREWFKYQLRCHGSSFSAIAAQLGISRAAVSQYILTPSPDLANAVAAVLGKPKSELWPAKYPEG